MICEWAQPLPLPLPLTPAPSLDLSLNWWRRFFFIGKTIKKYKIIKVLGKSRRWSWSKKQYSYHSKSLWSWNVIYLLTCLDGGQTSSRRQWTYGTSGVWGGECWVRWTGQGRSRWRDEVSNIRLHIGTLMTHNLPLSLLSLLSSPSDPSLLSPLSLLSPSLLSSLLSLLSVSPLLLVLSLFLLLFKKKTFAHIPHPHNVTEKTFCQ